MVLCSLGTTPYVVHDDDKDIDDDDDNGCVPSPKKREKEEKEEENVCLWSLPSPLNCLESAFGDFELPGCGNLGQASAWAAAQGIASATSPSPSPSSSSPMAIPVSLTTSTSTVRNLSRPADINHPPLDGEEKDDREEAPPSSCVDGDRDEDGHVDVDDDDDDEVWDVVRVIVPPGVKCGQSVRVSAHDGTGRTLTVVVPPGVSPWSSFSVRFPPPHRCSSSSSSSSSSYPRRLRGRQRRRRLRGGDGGFGIWDDPAAVGTWVASGNDLTCSGGDGGGLPTLLAGCIEIGSDVDVGSVKLGVSGGYGRCPAEEAKGAIRQFEDELRLEQEASLIVDEQEWGEERKKGEEEEEEEEEERMMRCGGGVGEVLWDGRWERCSSPCTPSSKALDLEAVAMGRKSPDCVVGPPPEVMGL